MICLLAACGSEARGGADAAPEPDATRIEIWTRIPGATARIGDDSTVLDEEGGVVTVTPPLRTTSMVLVIESGEARVELPEDWSLDYEASHLAPDTPLERLLVEVGPDERGECITGHTNGLAGGIAFFSDGPPEPGACGPFDSP